MKIIKVLDKTINNDIIVNNKDKEWKWVNKMVIDVSLNCMIVMCVTVIIVTFINKWNKPVK